MRGHACVRACVCFSLSLSHTHTHSLCLSLYHSLTTITGQNLSHRRACYFCWPTLTGRWGEKKSWRSACDTEPGPPSPDRLTARTPQVSMTEETQQNKQVNSKVMSEQLNCWWGWQNTDLQKWTHQCNETHRNNSKQVLLTQIVFFGSKKIDRQQKKKEAKKRTVLVLSVLFFVSFFFCWLSIVLQPKKTIFVKALVYYCFRVFHHIGDISLDPFYLINSDLKSNVTP